MIWWWFPVYRANKKAGSVLCTNTGCKMWIMYNDPWIPAYCNNLAKTSERPCFSFYGLWRSSPMCQDWYVHFNSQETSYTCLDVGYTSGIGMWDSNLVSRLKSWPFLYYLGLQITRSELVELGWYGLQLVLQHLIHLQGGWTTAKNKKLYIEHAGGA